jgi:hypothetical protein
MALDAQHPSYARRIHEWVKLRDCFEGEDAIKAKRAAYLPPTPGQLLDGMQPGTGIKPAEQGWQSYENYIARARFPEYVEEAVKQMVGAMHNKPPVIELPPPLEPLLERGTIDGESLALLLRKINAEQLLVGRIGLMADAAKDGDAVLPYIATYMAEHMINWDDGSRSAPLPQSLNLVILNEIAPLRQPDFTWEDVPAYRVLVLGDPMDNEAEGLYQQALFVDTTQFDSGALTPPSIKGMTLTKMPFVFVNATDVVPEPSKAPLLKLANACLGIYLGEADYRFNLFLQAQDTLVLIGDDKEDRDTRVGAGAKINVPTGGDAKYIGVSADGLGEQREALENDHKRAKELGSQLIDTTSRMKESGEALKVRVSAETATLKDIAQTGAEGLQTLLRIVAEWVGADPEKVNVKPNLDFAEAGLTPADFVNLMLAKEKGLPISDESAHELAFKNNLTRLEFAEEIGKVTAEREKKMEMAIKQAQATKPAQPPQGREQPPQPKKGE